MRCTVYLPAFELNWTYYLFYTLSLFLFNKYLGNVGDVSNLSVLSDGTASISVDSQHIPIWKNGKRVQWLWPDRVSHGDVVVFGSLRYVFRISVEDPVAQPVTVSLQNHVPDASRPSSLSFTLSRKLAATHTQTLPMPAHISATRVQSREKGSDLHGYSALGAVAEQVRAGGWEGEVVLCSNLSF